MDSVPKKGVFRCLILDSGYGVCLFDKLWDTKQKDKDPATLSKLIFSFFQISSSLKASQSQGSPNDVKLVEDEEVEVLFQSQEVRTRGRRQQQRGEVRRLVGTLTTSEKKVRRKNTSYCYSPRWYNCFCFPL
eukprot:TRINITY_DN3959_c0_g2_i10.p1 TRINITY_DN3959_c0_g2~~TRINITY_DN3959_c0_g2_i10.p1  ORF type:complete len:132 (+),score=12.95 TRINITY_DN3959_c0_g2_i10:121-516(+)